MIKKLMIVMLVILATFSTVSFAAITEEQGNDVAEFAKKFIEEGNARRDENGFPLLTYCLSGNWKTCIEIRTKGYNGEMYHVKNNGYYIRNGRYLDLGEKWCMDCGTTVLFLLKNTLGFEVLNSQGEPWHVQDVYNDALKGEKSQYFDMVYKSVAVGRIDYSKLQKGDFIAYITSHGNHGMLYLGDGLIAHANRDMIRSYGDNKISGFQVSKLNQYFLSGTPVRIMRLKDGVIPTDLVVNGFVTWPDTGETVDLLNRPVIEEIVNIEEENGVIAHEVSGDEPLLIVADLREKAENDVKNAMQEVIPNNSFNSLEIVKKEKPAYYGRFQKLWEQYVKSKMDGIDAKEV